MPRSTYGEVLAGCGALLRPSLAWAQEQLESPLPFDVHGELMFTATADDYKGLLNVFVSYGREDREGHLRVASRMESLDCTTFLQQLEQDAEATLSDLRSRLARQVIQRWYDLYYCP